MGGGSVLICAWSTLEGRAASLERGIHGCVGVDRGLRFRLDWMIEGVGRVSIGLIEGRGSTEGRGVGSIEGRGRGSIED
jgi:hypothetical protein